MHPKIISFIRYQRYAFSKDEIQELLERIENHNN